MKASLVKSATIATALMGLVIFQGCASSPVDKQVTQEINQQPAITKPAELAQEATTTIENTPGLTADQRTKLLALRDSTHQQMGALQEESLKIRSLLIKEVIAPKYKRAEVAILKKRLKAAEEKKVSLTFDTIDKANVIMGHDQIERTRDVRDLQLREQVLRNIL